MKKFHNTVSDMQTLQKDCPEVQFFKRSTS